MQTITEFIKGHKDIAPDQLALMCETIGGIEECRIYIIAEYGDINYEEELDDYTISLFKENCSDTESFEDTFDGEDVEIFTDVYWLSVANYYQLIRSKKIENILK